MVLLVLQVCREKIENSIKPHISHVSEQHCKIEFHSSNLVELITMQEFYSHIHHSGKQ